MASESRSGPQEGNRVRVLSGAWEMWKGTGDTEQPSEGEWKSSCHLLQQLRQVKALLGQVCPFLELRFCFGAAASSRETTLSQVLSR